MEDGKEERSACQLGGPGWKVHLSIGARPGLDDTSRCQFMQVPPAARSRQVVSYLRLPGCAAFMPTFSEVAWCLLEATGDFRS